jgi:hypothetical protein
VTAPPLTTEEVAALAVLRDRDRPRDRLEGEQGKHDHVLRSLELRTPPLVALHHDDSFGARFWQATPDGDEALDDARRTS